MTLLQSEYDAETSEVQDLGGSSNLNIRITIDGEPHVARAYRPYVTAQRLEDLQRVREAVAAEGVPTPDGRQTKNGQPFTQLGERLIEVERFVDRDAEMDTWQNLGAGLPTLGRIHNVLARERVASVDEDRFFANYIAAEDVVTKTGLGVTRIQSWSPTAEEFVIAEMAIELAELVYEGERMFAGKLPVQVVHGDFWDNNVLFRGGDLVLVTDYDYMSARPRIDDLALTLYFTNCAFREGVLDPPRRAELRRLVDAYESGLDGPLSDDECSALPWAIARQPLWSIGGWVVRLDNEDTARRHVSGMEKDLEWTLAMAHAASSWADAFTGEAYGPR
ncbi:MAG: phosphotransferase [Actinomycetota bacterium]